LVRLLASMYRFARLLFFLGEFCQIFNFNGGNVSTKSVVLQFWKGVFPGPLCIVTT
jgi:hypothetical protein